MRRRSVGGHRIELLPAAPYSGSDPTDCATIGVCLQRQRGVHSIGTDRRSDFDRLPGTVSFAPAGLDIFSESPEGGEFLAVRLAGPDVHIGAERVAGILAMRHEIMLRHAFRLRAAMLDAQTTGDPLEDLLLDFLALVLPSPPQMSAREPSGWIGGAISLLTDAILSERAIDLVAVASAFGLSAPALTRGFRQSTGMTPLGFVRELRLQKARRLLVEQPATPIADVAAACGFAHQSHLGAVIRAEFGVTPGRYRRTHTPYR